MSDNTLAKDMMILIPIFGIFLWIVAFASIATVLDETTELHNGLIFILLLTVAAPTLIIFLHYTDKILYN